MFGQPHIPQPVEPVITDEMWATIQEGQAEREATLTTRLDRIIELLEAIAAKP